MIINLNRTKDGIYDAVKQSYITTKDHTYVTGITHNKLVMNKHHLSVEVIVHHIGKTPQDGHYVVQRKINGNWYEFDDDEIYEVSSSELKARLSSKEHYKTTACLLLFKVN